jgi:hypothetical protein
MFHIRTNQNYTPTSKKDASIEDVLLAINTLLHSLNSYHLKDSIHFAAGACGNATRDGLTSLLQLATYCTWHYCGYMKPTSKYPVTNI